MMRLSLPSSIQFQDRNGKRRERERSKLDQKAIEISASRNQVFFIKSEGEERKKNKHVEKICVRIS